MALAWPFAGPAEAAGSGRLEGANLHALRVRPGGGDAYVATASAAVAGQGGWTFGALVGHASGPLLFGPQSRAGAAYVANGEAITSHTVVDLVGSVGLLDFLDLGVAVPLVVDQQGETAAGLDDPNTLGGARGVGDVRLLPKVALVGFGRPDGPHIAAAAEAGVALPTGDREAFQGGGLQYEPQLVVEGRMPGGAALSVNAGYGWRDTVQVLDQTVESGPLWAVGLNLPITEGLSGNLEAFRTTSTEALLAARIGLGEATVQLGAGLGLDDAAGNPDWRLFAGVAMQAAGDGADRLFLGGGDATPAPAAVRYAVAPAPPPPIPAPARATGTETASPTPATAARTSLRIPTGSKTATAARTMTTTPTGSPTSMITARWTPSRGPTACDRAARHGGCAEASTPSSTSPPCPTACRPCPSTPCAWSPARSSSRRRSSTSGSSATPTATGTASFSRRSRWAGPSWSASSCWREESTPLA